jgi:hypothetical protein
MGDPPGPHECLVYPEEIGDPTKRFSVSMLHVAVLARKLPLLSRLLQRSRELADKLGSMRIDPLFDDAGGHGRTPLQDALRLGWIEGAALLLAQGADPNFVSRDVHNKALRGATPLHYAAAHGNPDLVELCLRWGADLGAMSEGGQNVLHIAGARGNLVTFSLLLEKLTAPPGPQENYGQRIETQKGVCSAEEERTRKERTAAAVQMWLFDQTDAHGRCKPFDLLSVFDFSGELHTIYLQLKSWVGGEHQREPGSSPRPWAFQRVSVANVEAGMDLGAGRMAVSPGKIGSHTVPAKGTGVDGGGGVSFDPGVSTEFVYLSESVEVGVHDLKWDAGTIQSGAGCRHLCDCESSIGGQLCSPCNTTSTIASSTALAAANSCSEHAEEPVLVELRRRIHANVARRVGQLQQLQQPPDGHARQLADVKGAALEAAEEQGYFKTGHCWLRQKVMRVLPGCNGSGAQLLEGTIVSWIPEEEGEGSISEDPAYWKLRRTENGDLEDLDAAEVREGLAQWAVGYGADSRGAAKESEVFSWVMEKGAGVDVKSLMNEVHAVLLEAAHLASPSSTSGINQVATAAVENSEEILIAGQYMQMEGKNEKLTKALKQLQDVLPPGAYFGGQNSSTARPVESRNGANGDDIKINPLVAFEYALLLLRVLEHSLSGHGCMKDSWEENHDWNKATEWRMALQVASAKAIVEHVAGGSIGKHIADLCSLVQELEAAVQISCMDPEWTKRDKAAECTEEDKGKKRAQQTKAKSVQVKPKPKPAKRKRYKKDPTKKDPTEPKKAMSAYLCFSVHWRETYTGSAREFMTRAAAEWKQLDAEAKRPYEEMATTHKQRYAEEKKEHAAKKLKDAAKEAATPFKSKTLQPTLLTSFATPASADGHLQASCQGGNLPKNKLFSKAKSEPKRTMATDGNESEDEDVTVYLTKKDNERPDTIARVFDVSTSTLLRWNSKRLPGIKSNSKLELGTEVIVGKDSEGGASSRAGVGGVAIPGSKRARFGGVESGGGSGMHGDSEEMIDLCCLNQRSAWYHGLDSQTHTLAQWHAHLLTFHQAVVGSKRPAYTTITVEKNDDTGESRELLGLPKKAAGSRRIFECSSYCLCGPRCMNRCVQLGVQLELQVFDAGPKGFAVRATTAIPKHTFVCEYVGELISLKEADRREDIHHKRGAKQGGPKDMTYQLPLGDRNSPFYIDAKYYGNVARFFNHSCEPNLYTVLVFAEHRDKRFPRPSFFATRDIEAGEELTFSYGSANQAQQSDMKCLCGSRNCRGNMPT